MTQTKFKRLFLLLISLTLYTQSTIASTTLKSRILILGDSLSAAYGIPYEQGWVALAQKEIDDKAIITNASISGETTVGGLQSLPEHLERVQPDIVVIELGANDGLRGFPLPGIKNNLQALVDLSKQANAKVVLLGIHIPPNYGKRYTEGFYQNFLNIAEQNELEFVPFMLDGVALKSELMQSDRLHPNADGQPIILNNVLPAITRALNELHAD